MPNDRYIIWDFDGTLGQRAGMWSGALLEVLRANGIAPHLTATDLRPFLAGGFRWHNPHVKNLPGTSAEEWWNELDPIFECAFRKGAGAEEVDARRLAKDVRKAYTLPSQWSLFPDTLQTLTLLSAQGWQHVMLSNHVPELGSILQSLGARNFFVAVFNSAGTGVEKPHPEAFENVRSALPPGAQLWMVGDSFAADVQGAESAGIPAILVRKPHRSAKRYAENLPGVIPILENAG